MLEAAEAEFAVVVGLAGQRAFITAARLTLTIDDGRVGNYQRAACQARCDRPQITMVFRRANNAANARRGIELMCVGERRYVGLVALNVRVRQPIKRVDRHVERFAVEVRHAVIGNVLVLKMVVGNLKLVGSADAPAHRRGEARAIGFHFIAKTIAPGTHRIDADGHVVADDLIGVDRGTRIVVLTEREPQHRAVADGRRFADLIDDAAGGAATIEH